MKISKKTLLGLIIIFIILLIGTFLGYNLKKNSYKEINFKEYEELLNSKDKFILFIGADSCSHCTNYKKTINRVIKDYKITVYYIDIGKLSDKQYARIKSYFPFEGTPTTIVIKNKEEYNRIKTRIDGDKDYDTIVEKLKNADIIK